MKNVLFVVLMSFFSGITVSAQDYAVPQNYKLEDKEDYATYEPQVKETIDWLLQTPLGKNGTKRKEANTFLMAWLSGSPTVSININADFIFFKTNPELLMIFIAGWTKYSLENDYSKDQL